MTGEDWYRATEAFLECLRLNPAHAEGTAALAECYYELGEYDEALAWARKARSLARASTALANLEAFILIALGRLDEAAPVINEALAREPYNREALFAAAELDIARGRAGEAVLRYREAVRRYPDDRRLLLSLALVLGSLGDLAGGRSYIERALAQYPGDYRVYYYAAYLDAQGGKVPEAIGYVEQALHYRPGYIPARSLLSKLRYRAGQYEEAARLADELIALDREDTGSWYLKGLSLVRLHRKAEALSVFSLAAAIDPEDEFVRSALEELLLSETRLDHPDRARWARWHFDRAREYSAHNFIEQALFEYRRGLRLNPYSPDRREYANLLRLQGYPSRYLEELRFIQNLGLADRDLNDAVETYDALLASALFRRWEVDFTELVNRHWKTAVFSVDAQSGFYHVDAGAQGAAYVKDLLVHDRNITPMDLELRQSSFSEAFRAAREAGADYFFVISVTESERDLSLKGELFVGRTGALADTFYVYRTGADRLRNASRNMVDQLGAALPFRSSLIRRRQSQGLIDKGRLDGVQGGMIYEVVKKGRPQVRNEGIGLVYADDEIVGTLEITAADEEVAAGSLKRSGFFDRIAPGDEILLKPASREARPAPAAADPQLRALLRTLR
jgi:tetratricopeptide (TPR) repeat protein